MHKTEILPCSHDTLLAGRGGERLGRGATTAILICLILSVICCYNALFVDYFEESPEIGVYHGNAASNDSANLGLLGGGDPIENPKPH